MMAEHWKHQKSSGLPPGYYHYNSANRYYREPLGSYDKGRGERGGLGLGRHKLLWQSLLAAAVFGLVIGVLRSPAPQMMTAAASLRGYFTTDSDAAPVMAWLAQVGSGADSFERAGYEVVRANGLLSRIDEEMAVPVSGKVVAGFGWPGDGGERFRQGVTIETAADEPIKAAYAGTVLTVSADEDGLYAITIAHANGLVTTYGACSVAYVMVDQMVDKGEVIGLCRNTADGAGELYFETKHLGEPVDPLCLLESEEV